MGLLKSLFGGAQPLRRPDAPRILLLPEAGLEHPVFANFHRGDAMEVLLTCTAPFSKKEVRLLNAHYHLWADGVDWQAAGGDPSFRVETDGQTLRVGFFGVNDPKPAVRQLINAFSDAGFGLREVLLGRREVDDDGSPGSFVHDELQGEDCQSEEEFWSRSFDPTLTPPYAEDPCGMLSMCVMEGSGMVAEKRPFHLGRSDVRVGYGLCNVDDRPSDARGREVFEALIGHLDRSFAGLRPSLYNQAVEADVRFDHIEKGSRRGYAFAIKRDDMLVQYPGSFRYRELELMNGAATAIEELLLAPVIHWDRDSVYIVNLWEK